VEAKLEPLVTQKKKATSPKPVVKPSAPAYNHAFSLPISVEDNSALTQPSLADLPVSAVSLAPPVAAQSAVPPPGLMAPKSASNMQPNMPPPGVGFPPGNGMRLPMDQGQLGEIRATAKAFVPTSFGSSIPGADSGRMPSLSGTFANPQPSSGMPPLAVPPAAPEGTSIMQSAFPPGILSGGLGGSSGNAPGLIDSDKLNGQDRMPAMTPISTDSTTNTTTASLSGFEESNFAGLPLGFGMDIPHSSGGTSSLLDSFAAGGGNVGASSIWGGPQGVSSALGGFSAFGGLGGGNAPAATDPGYNNDDTRYNHNNNNNNNNNSNLWGSDANPATSNPGSIW